jgi:hypothetical protein
MDSWKTESIYNMPYYTVDMKHVVFNVVKSQGSGTSRFLWNRNVGTVLSFSWNYFVISLAQ